VTFTNGSTTVSWTSTINGSPSTSGTVGFIDNTTQYFWTADLATSGGSITIGSTTIAPGGSTSSLNGVAINPTTPETGQFTTLAASTSVISPAADFATIGAITPGSGVFTSINGLTLEYLPSTSSIYFGEGVASSSAAGQDNVTFGYGAGSNLATSGITQGQADVFMGYMAGNACTTCRDSVAIGSNAMPNLTGTGQGAEDATMVAIGSEAMEGTLAQVSGNYSGQSVAVGQKSLVNGAYLYATVAIGTHSGDDVTSSDDDVIIGANALGSAVSPSVTSSENVIIGDNGSGYAATGSITDNVAVGWGSGAELTGGSTLNSFFGWTTGGSCTTCTNEVLIGAVAGGSASSTASYNVGVGVQALQNVSSNSNVAVGYAAAEGLTSGSATAVGSGACTGVATGTANSCFGHAAGENTGTTVQGGVYVGDTTGFTDKGNFDTVVGANAMGVGVSPTGGLNTLVGYGAGYLLTSGTENTAVGYNAGSATTSGVYNIAIGSRSGYTYPTTGAVNILIGQDLNTVAGGTFYEVNIGGALMGYSSTSGITVTSGGGTSPTISGAGTFFFKVTEGTGTPSATLVLAMPTASTDWGCDVADRSSTTINGHQTGAASTTQATFTFSAAPAAGDVIQVKCLMQ